MLVKSYILSELRPSVTISRDCAFILPEPSECSFQYLGSYMKDGPLRTGVEVKSAPAVGTPGKFFLAAKCENAIDGVGFLQLSGSVPASEPTSATTRRMAMAAKDKVTAEFEEGGRWGFGCYCFPTEMCSFLARLRN